MNSAPVAPAARSRPRTRGSRCRSCSTVMCRFSSPPFSGESAGERGPAPPLLPREPAARAFARITEDVCDTHYEAVNWGFSEVHWYKRASGELADRLKAEVARQTTVLQDWLTARLGSSPWLGGDTFGWADAAAAPMVNRSVHYGMGPKAGTPLAAWHSRLRGGPSVA